MDGPEGGFLFYFPAQILTKSQVNPIVIVASFCSNFNSIPIFYSVFLWNLSPSARNPILPVKTEINKQIQVPILPLHDPLAIWDNYTNSAGFLQQQLQHNIMNVYMTGF